MIDDTTFCYWRRNCDNEWHSGKIKFPANVGADPDGSRTMLKILDGKPKTYVDYAREYFDLEIAEEDVKHVYQLKPLNAELLIRLHCERNLDQLSDEIKEIGYIRGT